MNINGFELDILTKINFIVRNGVFDRVMPIISALGDAGIVWIGISIILICTKKYRRIGLISLCSILVTIILGEGIIKNIVRRSRPYMSTGVGIFLKYPGTYSFPSGHTSISFAAAYVLAHNSLSWGIIAYTLAILIAFSRIYLMVHYPTDVLGGIVLGTLTSMIMLKVINKKNKTTI